MSIAELSRFQLPVDAGIVRDLPPRTIVSDPCFWQYYDRNTLFYDVFWDRSEQSVHLFAPKFFNLESLLQDWTPHVDACRILQVRLKRYRKFDVVTCRVPKDHARVLSFQVAGRAHELTIQPVEHQQFSSLNVLCTLSKNNDLRWLRDWMTFHHRHHGANGLLLFDNDSDAYSPEELHECVRSVPGFVTTQVVPVPLLYGPQRGAKGLGRANFLQVALLNLARARFLKHAASVLCIDIDELVCSRQGHSVFEATSASRLGFLAFEGAWRYAQTDSAPPRHHDHQWLAPADLPCPSKYCYQPSAWLGRQTLDVHGLSLISRHMFPVSAEFSFFHCRSISTSWKERRENPFHLRWDGSLPALFQPSD